MDKIVQNPKQIEIIHILTNKNYSLTQKLNKAINVLIKQNSIKN